MTEELNETQEEQDNRIYVGLSPFGGIRVHASNATLSPQEAFVLAGQLMAHATIVINAGYMEQAMAQAQVQRPDIVVPGR